MGFSLKLDSFSGVQADALKVLWKQRVAMYRPSRFRGILPVVSGGVPSWVQSLEVETSTSFAEFRPAGQANDNPSTGTEEITVDNFKTLKMQSAFSLLDDEVAAYAASGKSPSAKRIVGIQTKSEQILNDIAANGYSGARIKGLLNQANAASPTDAQVHLASSTMATLVGAVAEDIAEQFVTMVQSLNDESLENYDASKIVLPTTEYNAAAKIRSAIDNRTALEIFGSSHPEVQVTRWNKCNSIGTNSTGRAVVMTAANDVLEMVNVYELQQGKTIPTLSGVDVAMQFKTAGVIVYEPRGLEYWDFEA